MRAVVFEEYGSPDVLRVADVPVPTPAAGELLVRVEATSVNLTDWEGVLGRPAYARIGGVRRPARTTLGSDIAGVVESVGTDVGEFAPGDAIYADNLEMKGGFADYAIVRAKAAAHKPDALSFVDASTVPQTGAIAMQGTNRAAPGVRLAINGGGGGSGTFAIQLAKRAGAHVTAIDNHLKLEFMTSLGADAVVDYERDDFTRGDGPYDLILDLVAHRSVFAYRRALAPGGHYRWVGGSVPTLFRVMTAGTVVGRLTRRRIGLLVVHEGPEHFAPIGQLIAEGDVETRIDSVVGLDDVADAIRRVGEGRVLGKVVVTP